MYSCLGAFSTSLRERSPELEDVGTSELRSLGHFRLRDLFKRKESCISFLYNEGNERRRGTAVRKVPDDDLEGRVVLCKL